MINYKKHIAIFFLLLFVASQASHVMHDLFESHDYSSNISFSYENDDESDISSDQITSYNEISSSDLHDCLLCQHNQSIKLYKDIGFEFDIKRILNITYKGFDYIKPLLSSYLLRSTSLRAPPTAS